MRHLMNVQGTLTRLAVGLGTLALAAGCTSQTGRSPISPSASDSAYATAVQPPPNGATTVSFSGFDAGTLTVNINTTTTSSLATSVIDAGKIQLQILVDASGNPVPCGTVGATYVRLDQAPGGGLNPSSALTSQNFDLDNLDTFSGGTIHNVACGASICIRAHYIPGGGSPHVDSHQSDETPYAIVCAFCTSGQGYWKHIYPTWPVSALQLGSVSYTAAQLESILLEDAGVGPAANGLVILAHQLIAAKLNVARGAPAPAAIASADTLIGSLIVPPVAGAGYLAPADVSALTQALDTFNNSVPCQ